MAENNVIVSSQGRNAWIGVVVAIGTLALIAATPTDLYVQGIFGITILTLLLILRRSEPLLQRFRLFFLYLSLFLMLRYLIWRLMFTLEYVHLADFVAALILYLAELFSITLALLSVIVNIRPKTRQIQEISLEDPDLPTVDVFIPTYNEPFDLVFNTLIAATQLQYPAGKFQVYLLDDGGTQEKCAQENEAGSTARARRARLQQMCSELGAQYLTRDTNEQAKAGNLNAALRQTEGELILFLDADHVPTEDFLLKTVQPFLADPKLFLVQTPHFFINPDPVERNLERVHEVPAESEMFYGVIQRGMDRWNASFFCGSAAVMRRHHLESIGGICTDTVTEDAETALTLHAKGLNSIYIGQPMISGLQPETFTSFVRQRMRWAQGMVQIFLKKNPLFYKGLSLPQRISYTSSTLFWFFPYARVVFMLAPAAYLLFGLHIYKATIPEVIAYALPYLLALVLINDILFGKHRWTLVSELYELMQSLFGVRALTRVIMNPDSPSFTVTPKGEYLDHKFVSQFSRPFYVLFAILLGSLGMAVWRYYTYPQAWQVISITLFWTLINLGLLFAAFGVLLEQRQRRAHPRMPVNLPAELCGENFSCSGLLKDLSATGGAMRVSLLSDEKAVEQVTSLQVMVGMVLIQLPVKIVKVNTMADGYCSVRLEFEPKSLAHRRSIVRLVFGDSERWRQYQEARASRIHGVRAGVSFVARAGLRHGQEHIAFLFRQWIQRLRGPAPTPAIETEFFHNDLKNKESMGEQKI